MGALTLLMPVISTLIDKFFPDASQNAEAKAKLLEMQVNGELQGMLGQLEVNKAEANNSSVFVSGWRPAIGWVCAFALFYQYIGRPIATAFAASIGHPLPAIPGLDDNLWQLLLGMLGLGGLRTYEKINGVTK